MLGTLEASKQQKWQWRVVLGCHPHRLDRFRLFRLYVQLADRLYMRMLFILDTNPEIVKRWSNEVQEAVQSRAALVQFHALALHHQIRQNDRLAVNKLDLLDCECQVLSQVKHGRAIGFDKVYWVVFYKVH
ncbi:hypothetical protein J1N35_041331 [Gossypium stocksii]|uniref:Uncharacterized protein n=1 Tax=Gossypium stocksii TaxID=47602 RepID=A0A9D3UFT1_9ROSI|nr:hypothetical protein J1N35_041331 [Gossypium stocksii]